MSQPAGSRSPITLALCTILHTFTHAYGVMLPPLYTMMVADFHLSGVKFAGLLMTVYGIFYSGLSYGAGVLADRVNRKDLLGWGLVVNAIAILGMGLTRRYEVLIALSVLGGIAGTIFHPAANALVPAHFPKSPGMAIGLLGIGSGLGFFFGPQFAGWRAVHANWHFASVASWQKPFVELGILGILSGVAFLVVAREAPGSHATRPAPRPLGPRLRRLTIAIAFTLGCRDFAGVASVSLLSIFLLKAQHRSIEETGFILGAMMLLAVVVNPVIVWLCPGRRRLPMMAGSFALAACVICTIPWVSRGWVLPVLCCFQACQLGSYALSDAAMLERIDAPLRGRVIGLFLMFAGTAAQTSPWIMGAWTDAFGTRASDPMAYIAPFFTLGILMLVASLSIPFIARLGPVQDGAIDPLTEISPATMEVGV